MLDMRISGIENVDKIHQRMEGIEGRVMANVAARSVILKNMIDVNLKQLLGDDAKEFITSINTLGTTFEVSVSMTKAGERLYYGKNAWSVRTNAKIENPEDDVWEDDTDRGTLKKEIDQAVKSAVDQFKIGLSVGGKFL